MVDPERKKRAIKEAQESFDRGIPLDNRKFRCELTGYDGLYFEAKFKKEGVELTKEILKDPVLDCHPRINQCSELKNILDGIEKKIFQKRYRKNGMEKLVKEGDLNEIIIG